MVVLESTLNYQYLLCLLGRMPAYCYVVYVFSPEDKKWVQILGQFESVNEAWQNIFQYNQAAQNELLYHGIRIRKTISFGYRSTPPWYPIG